MTENVSAMLHPAKSSKVGLGYTTYESELNIQFIHTSLDSKQREIHPPERACFAKFNIWFLQSLLEWLQSARALLFLRNSKQETFELLVRGPKWGEIIFPEV